MKEEITDTNDLHFDYFARSNYYDYLRHKKESEKIAEFLITSFCSNKHLVLTHLDLGAGYGFLVEEMRNYGMESYGIEISNYAIQRSSKRVRPFLCHGDIQEILYSEEDETLDLITALGVLDYCKEPDKIIDSCSRILKEKGNMVVTIALKSRDEFRVNVMPKKYWLSVCTGFGLTYDEEKSKLLSPKIFRSVQTFKSRFLPLKIIERYYSCMVFEK